MKTDAMASDNIICYLVGIVHINSNWSTMVRPICSNEDVIDTIHGLRDTMGVIQGQIVRDKDEAAEKEKELDALVSQLNLNANQTQRGE